MNTPEPNILRVTFEEIQEFYKLNLDKLPVDAVGTTYLLRYVPAENEFEAVPISPGGDGGLDITITHAKLKEEINADPSFNWVVKKDFRKGMEFTDVMRQLLTPPMPASAKVTSSPAAYFSWKDSSITITSTYSPGTNGILKAVTGTYDGDALSFSVSGNKAIATINTGEKTVHEGADYRTAPISVDMEYYLSGDSGVTGSAHASANGRVVTPIVVGFATDGDIDNLDAEILAAVEWNSSDTDDLKSKIASLQTSHAAAIAPYADITGYHWIASTRTFSKWHQDGFDTNNGLTADTHNTKTVTVKGVTYHAYILNAPTKYDSITLIYE